jgi:sedoheptulose-bisphosphatase
MVPQRQTHKSPRLRSPNANHVGRTDLPLTPNGVKRMNEAAKALVGEDRLISCSTLSHIFVSPRLRAKQTLSILNLPSRIPVTETEALAEWDYGDYEGVATEEIKRSRPDGKWEIWTDGCPGGESPAAIAARVDGLIARIQRMQAQAVEEKRVCDVLLVAHGHVLRALTARWLGMSVAAGRNFLLNAGGVGALS